MANLDDIQAKVSVESDTGAVDDAKNALSGFGDYLQQIGSIAAGIGLEKLIQNFVELGTSIAQAGFKAVTSGEQMAIGFGSAFGTGSSGMLKGIEDLSLKTPILTAQLDNMALKLKIAGVPANEIKGTLKDIADVSSGTGTSMEDISQKADAMAQSLARAEQYGKVSSFFLRPLISDNIPIIDALVKAINASGGAYDESAKSIAANAKEIETAKEKHEALIHQITDEKKQLDIINETHIKLGFGVKNSAKIQDEHTKAIEDAKYKLAQLNEELLKNDKALQGKAAQPVTKEELLSSGKSLDISASQLKAAYTIMAETYSGDALKQANTFNGTIQRTGEAFLIMAKDIIGVNSDDTVRKGSLFETLKSYASQFFDYLQAHKGEISDWFKKELQVFINYVIQHKGDIENFFKTLLTDLQGIGKWYNDNQPLFNALLGLVNGLGTVATNVQFLSSTQGQHYMQQNIATSPILPFIPGGNVVKDLSGINNSRNTTINMHNNVAAQSDWSSVANYLGWIINQRG